MFTILPLRKAKETGTLKIFKFGAQNKSYGASRREGKGPSGAIAIVVDILKSED